MSDLSGLIGTKSAVLLDSVHCTQRAETDLQTAVWTFHLFLFSWSHLALPLVPGLTGTWAARGPGPSKCEAAVCDYETWSQRGRRCSLSCFVAPWLRSLTPGLISAVRRNPIPLPTLELLIKHSVPGTPWVTTHKVVILSKHTGAQREATPEALRCVCCVNLRILVLHHCTGNVFDGRVDPVRMLRSQRFHPHSGSNVSFHLTVMKSSGWVIWRLLITFRFKLSSTLLNRVTKSLEFLQFVFPWYHD